MIITIQTKGQYNGKYKVFFNHTKKDTELRLQGRKYNGVKEEFVFTNVWKTTCTFEQVKRSGGDKGPWKTWSGETICSPSDIFIKEEGRKHSFKRAIGRFNRKLRTMMWKEYHEQTKPCVCEILNNGNWKAIPFHRLKEGDIFRLWSNLRGEYITDGEVQIATSSSFQLENSYVWDVASCRFTPKAYKQIVIDNGII